MSYEYKAKMMLGAIQDAKDDYINATREEDKEEYRFEIRQLENLKVLYEDAAKADEYEAKAKAYDDTLKTLDKLINNDERYKEARSNDFVAGMLIAYENIFNLMGDYIKESGESNAKK